MKPLLFLIATLPLTAQSLPRNWAGCGPTFDGHHIGASCSYAQQIASSPTYGWAEYDAKALLHGQSSTISVGIAVRLAGFSLGRASVHLMSITTGGSTQTATATTASMSQGFSPVVLWKSGWSLAPIVKEVTGAARGTEASLKVAFTW